MRQDLADITVVLDRSGSMQAIRTDMEGGLSEFIRSQQKNKVGSAVFSLWQFDTAYECVHNAVPLENVNPVIPIEPRGWTALLDAVGRAINETGKRLADMPEADRPGLVVFVIITDGMENASIKFKKAQIREMIERQRNQFNWQFTFLGANQDAFAEAVQLGMDVKTAGTYDPANAKGMMAAASSNVIRMRGAAAMGLMPDNAYTEQERIAMGGSTNK